MERSWVIVIQVFWGNHAQVVKLILFDYGSEIRFQVVIKIGADIFLKTAFKKY